MIFDLNKLHNNEVVNESTILGIGKVDEPVFCIYESKDTLLEAVKDPESIEDNIKKIKSTKKCTKLISKLEIAIPKQEAKLKKFEDDGNDRKAEGMKQVLEISKKELEAARKHLDTLKEETVKEALDVMDMPDVMDILEAVQKDWTEDEIKERYSNHSLYKLRKDLAKAKTGEAKAKADIVKYNNKKETKKNQFRAEISKELENYWVDCISIITKLIKEKEAEKIEEGYNDFDSEINLVESFIDSGFTEVIENVMTVDQLKDFNKKKSAKKLTKYLQKLEKSLPNAEKERKALEDSLKTAEGKKADSINKTLDELKDGIETQKNEITAVKALIDEKTKGGEEVTESQIFGDEYYDPTIISESDTALLYEAAIEILLNENDVESFLENHNELSMVEYEGVLEARNIVRLNKESKLNQLRKVNIFTIAREKNNPKFKKLLTLWKMERKLEAELDREYGALADRRAKEMYRKGKNSKSKTVKKVADKVKKLFNGDNKITGKKTPTDKLPSEIKK